MHIDVFPASNALAILQPWPVGDVSSRSDIYRLDNGPAHDESAGISPAVTAHAAVISGYSPR